MIVPKMTVQEINQEVLVDMKSIPQAKTDAFEKDFRSIILKTPSSKFPISKIYEYKSKKRNTLYITLSASKRGKHNNPNISIHSIYERPEGKYAVLWSIESRITIFPPHFFDRYQERILKDNSVIRNEVIKQFVRSTDGLLSLEVDDAVKAVYSCFDGRPDNEDINVVAATNEGYCFGVREGKVTIIKTIISEEMLYEDQKQLFPKLKEVYNQLMSNLLT